MLNWFRRFFKKPRLVVLHQVYNPKAEVKFAEVIQTVPLRKVRGGFKIGRAHEGHDLDFALPNNLMTGAVGRNHWLFHNEGRDYSLEDMGSKYGTCVNAEQVAGSTLEGAKLDHNIVRLKHGDVIVPGKLPAEGSDVILVYDKTGRMKFSSPKDLREYAYRKEAGEE